MDDPAPRPSRLRAGLVGLLVGCVPVAGLLLAYGLTGDPQGDAGPAVRALLAAQQYCWNAGDLEGFMAGYLDSDGLTFYSGGTVNKGFAAVLARYRKRYQSDGKEMGRLTFSDLEVDPAGAAAVARGRWRVVTSREELDGLFTLVLRRHRGEWKIVHDHTSQSDPPKR